MITTLFMTKFILYANNENPIIKRKYKERSFDKNDFLNKGVN